MSNAHAMVIIPAGSGNPKDISVNNWSFVTTGTVAEASAAILSALAAFYTAVKPIYASSMDFGNARLKTYDRSDPIPRAPQQDVSLGLSGAGGGTVGAHECACCLSFQGSRVSGTSQARRRGRVYLGPIGSASITAGLIAPSTMTTIRTAALNLLTTTTGLPNVKWVVWSPTTGGEGGAVQVTNGWIDNAIDIQRRRGLAATTRQVFP